MTDSPIDLLEREHQIIWRLLLGLGRVLHALKRGDAIPPPVLYRAAAFLSEFADRRHHAKEEEALFPAMERAGIAECGGAIAVMKAEHEQGRAAIAALKSATDAYAERGSSGTDALAAAIVRIRSLYANHIAKEDHEVFPLAERLGGETMAELTRAFARIDEGFAGEDHEQLVEFAQNLQWRPAGQ